MQNWVKKFATQGALVGALIAAPSAVLGMDYCCDPCPSDCCNSIKIFAGADFLWWHQCVDDLDYAGVFTSNTVGNETIFTLEHEYNHLPWEPGARVWVGAYEPCTGWSLTGSYTLLYADHKSDVISPGNVVAGLIHPLVLELSDFIFDSAVSFYDTHYNHADALLSRNVSCWPCVEVTPFIGAAGIYFDQTHNVDYIGVNQGGAVHYVASYWGVGLKAGTGLTYHFNSCLGFFGNASATILSGKMENEITSTAFIGGSEIGTRSTFHAIDDPNHCHFVPGSHIQAGVEYTMDMCGSSASLRIGYEFINWWNMPNARRYIDDDLDAVALATSPSVANFGFHGVFVGAEIGF